MRSASSLSPATGLQFSPIEPARLGQWLQDSQAMTLRCHADLDDGRWVGPYLPIVNPPLWELGHVAWFLERWCLRHPGWPDTPSLMARADALYDSSRIAHVARWYLPLPGLQRTIDYLRAVTDRVLERLARDDTPEEWRYFVELALYHQDMHNEAFTYTRQTLGYANPYGIGDGEPSNEACAGDLSLPGGALVLGARGDEGFVFDNEKWAHEVTLAPFAISRCAVTAGEFLAFVEEGGYARREWWDEAGWRWRVAQGRRHPAYWRRHGTGWERRVFDRWRPLERELPVLHVNAYEAEAWCRWAGRRLPSEAEWEFAAAAEPAGGRRRYPWGASWPQPHLANLDSGRLVPAGVLAPGDSAWGCRQMLGNVWEWTASVFRPYPGFAPDPYTDYSQPWFGSHRVLRGGSFATPARLARNGFRNFYTPERWDVFAGFRTCA